MPLLLQKHQWDIWGSYFCSREDTQQCAEHRRGHHFLGCFSPPASQYHLFTSQVFVFPKFLFPSQSSPKLQPLLNILSFLCWVLNASVLQVEEEKLCQEASNKTLHSSSLQLLQHRSHNLRQPACNLTSVSFLSSTAVSASCWLSFCPGSPNYPISK